ncbi:hypothetical protein AMS68_002218 [Peltaster fructicola]|uniref:Translation initiation factor eIF4e n=1 Tax=Peltaster fructicola TaxID=286661 RepID=A0A6H0XPX2_9PEZI|nr:hypothetical protein AMS68_002218 [Peltaster fructicola]
MSQPSPLRISNLPRAGAEEAAATQSPARGAEMRDFLQARLQRSRTAPLIHSWVFYHDRQDRVQQEKDDSRPDYEARLVNLSEIDDVRSFWTVFNNFDIMALPLRDSIHLFHKGVKPIWEDPRNVKGGSWTFRVPKSQAAEFWKELCMMAIGEKLQSAVESNRTTFRDDICGISLGVRFNSHLIQVWNRDCEHTAGIDRILQVILAELSVSLKPREGSYYYKKHSEHAGFANGEPEPKS